MRRANHLAGALALALLALGCERDPDECERAAARVRRITSESPAQPNWPERSAAAALRTCRRGGNALHDPVLRCALDAPTDEAAKTCIDDFLDDVLEPYDPSPRPRGINPLLDEH